MSFKTIGFSCRPKKKVALFNSFIEYCKKEQNIRVVEIDLTQSPEDCPSVDVYLCKVTDDLNSTDEESKKKIQNLKKYVTLHSKMLWIEPIEKLEPILTRERMCQTFRSIGINQPSFQVIQSQHLSSISTWKVTLPVVIKAQAACGTDDSHQMALCFNENQLDTIRNSSSIYKDEYGYFLIQQFINHDAKVYKVYVLGNHVITQIRDSFPNYDVNQNHPILFSSQDLPIEKKIGKQHLSEKDALTLFGDTITLMRHALKMDMFGIDVIIDTDTKEQYVIDFNYFPGYYDVEKVNEWMFETIQERWNSVVQER